MPITDMLPGSHRKGWRRWSFAAASAVVHAGLLAALVLATDEDGEAAGEPEPEEVTYVDVARFAPPPPPASSQPSQPSQPEPVQPRPEPVRPEPVRPEPQPRQPEAAPRAADLLEPEDSLPEVPLGADVPPAPVAPPVSASPARVAPVTGGSGSGQAGGVEGGQEGGKEGGVVGGQGEAVPDPDGTYVAAVVDRQAELTNRGDLARILQRLYPSALLSARQGGRVVVQFVVAPNGRVDMGSVKIMSSTDGAFEKPTRDALKEFRFRPARMGDRNVRMLTQMPIVWEVR